LEGFDLHANITVGADDRAGLERLSRYVLRPPVAQDRIELTPEGRVLVAPPLRAGRVPGEARRPDPAPPDQPRFVLRDPGAPRPGARPSCGLRPRRASGRGPLGSRSAARR